MVSYRLCCISHSIHCSSGLTIDLPRKLWTGTRVSRLNVGSFTHADDIKATGINVDAAISLLVDYFSSVNSLRLNATKTELLQFTSGKSIPTADVIIGQKIKTQSTAKCLVAV